MRNFTDLEREHQFSPVYADNGNLAGYLHLAAGNTKAVLQSENTPLFEKDEAGWFDLELKDQRGSRVLLHNAFTRSQTMPGLRDKKSEGFFTSEIFPNIVVFGADKLSDARCVNQVAFQLEAAENFFVYDFIEWHSFYGQKDKHLVLKVIRDKAWKAPSSLKPLSDANDLSEVYLLHNPKTYFDVVADEMKIKVWHSRLQQGLGWTGHKIRVIPIISLYFASSITIDAALDRVWQTKSFFDQLALKNLLVQGLSISKNKKGWPYADVYLPNEPSVAKTPHRHLHPTQIPFSSWKDRKKFAAVLAKWLTFSQERRFFRSVVRLALARLEKENDSTLIPLLMAAVESLPELSDVMRFDKSTLDRMAQAASKENAGVDYGRVRGLLGALNQTSAKQRLRKLAAFSFDSGLDESDVDKLASAASQFRNKISHGDWMSDTEHEAAGNIARVLTYLCVTYDLQTSGFPIGVEEPYRQCIPAQNRMRLAWMSYCSAT